MVYIAYAKRSAIGSFFGSLSKLSSSDIGSSLVKDLINLSKIEDIDELIIGNVLQAGQGQNVSRQIVLKSNLKEDIVGYTVNMVCGSSLKAVMLGYSSILAGLSSIVVAGGVENMSQAPYLLDRIKKNKFGDLIVKDHMLHDGLMDYFNDYHMGVTAENLVQKYNISRQTQDEFAYKSQLKATVAIEKKYFHDEITPIKTGDDIFFEDEFVRLSPLSTLSKLKPAFKKGGSVTAGNSSGINDGGSALIMCNKKMLSKHMIKPLAKIISVSQSGIDPKFMGLAPVKAIKKALENARLSLQNIDLLELNEAFAAQSIALLKELCNQHNMDENALMQKTNIYGGAIALGHPIGATGARILTTLIYALRRKGLRYGLASLCIGGGMAVCVIVENTNL